MIVILMGTISLADEVNTGANVSNAYGESELPPLPDFEVFQLPSMVCQNLDITLTRFHDEVTFPAVHIALCALWPREKRYYDMAYDALSVFGYQLGQGGLKVNLSLKKKFLTFKTGEYQFKTRVSDVVLGFDTKGNLVSTKFILLTNWDYRLANILLNNKNKLPISIASTILSFNVDQLFNYKESFVTGIAFDQQGNEYEMLIELGRLVTSQ